MKIYLRMLFQLSEAAKFKLLIKIMITIISKLTSHKLIEHSYMMPEISIMPH